ncbi:hypothetical protein PRZ48_011698 [Zasmidium cellare]|uniref:Uncharacterized protein n=1 Tax=Zasmidium cellare TaxID=395010 RepID=A0ABR0E837_ZASCE|nr:hypothetical protein PRZ48_011698 [Zasmidium cellare]
MGPGRVKTITQSTLEETISTDSAGQRQSRNRHAAISQSPNPCTIQNSPVEEMLPSWTQSQLDRGLMAWPGQPKDPPCSGDGRTSTMTSAGLLSTMDLDWSLGDDLEISQVAHEEDMYRIGMVQTRVDPQYTCSNKHSALLHNLDYGQTALNELFPPLEWPQTKRTALHMAVQACNVEMAQRLLAYGADVDAKDSKGSTPLHYAVEASSKIMVNLILNWHPDMRCRDQNGRQPLHIAVGMGAAAIVDVLLRAGADINAQT